MAMPARKDHLRLIDGASAPEDAGAAPATSDASWVILARAGDRRAFEQLYRRHAPFALALAVRVQGHAGDVEDIVHDAFLRVRERLSSLSKEEAFRSWLAAIVVSLVRTRLRKRKLLQSLGLSSSEPLDLDVLASHGASPEVRAQVAQVYSVLSGLPVDTRIAWILRYVEGHKLEEVAALTHCSLATVKRRILTAQQTLLLETWKTEEEEAER